MKKSKIFLALFFAVHFTAGAALTGWDGGGANGSWTNAVNWSNNVAPAVGASLIFPYNKPHLTSTNTAGAVSNFNSLTFYGSNYVIYAPGFLTTNSISNYIASGTNTINAALTLNGTMKILDTNASSRLIINSNIALNGHQFFPSNTGTVEIEGVITGTGTVTKAGSGTLYLDGSNTFSSPLLLTAGTLGGSAYLPGITTSGGVISPGMTNGDIGVLTCNGDLVLSNATYVADLLTDGSNDNLTSTNNVILTNSTLALNLPTSGYFPTNRHFILSGHFSIPAVPINGFFNGLPEGTTFTNGVNLMTIGYTGSVGNSVFVQKVGATPFTWDGGGTDSAWNSKTNWVGNQLPPLFSQLVFPANAPRTVNTNSDITLQQFDSLLFTGSNYVITTSSGSLQLYSGITNSITAKSNIIHGAVALKADATFKNTAAGGTLLLDGTLDLGVHTLTIAGTGYTYLNSSPNNNGAIIKTDSGTLYLGGTNSGYDIDVAVSNGVAYLNGYWAGDGASLFTVSSGATLGGIGNAAGGEVLSGGILAPGFGGPGTLEFDGGDLALDSGSILNFDFSDSSPGDSDQIVLNGSTMEINGATLALSQIDITLPGDSITLVKLSGASSVSGTFAGLPEGAYILLGSGDFCRITYLGGSSGHDIVISDLGNGSPTGQTRQWTNGTGSLGWTNSSNWVGGTTPQPGDDLFFPTGINTGRKGKTITPAGTLELNRIVVASDGFSIGPGDSSSALRLTGGIFNTNPNCTISFSLPVSLAAPQTFSATTNGNINFQMAGASLDLGNNQLTLGGAGAVQLFSSLGNGSIVANGPTVLLSGSYSLGGGLVISNGVSTLNGSITNGPAVRVENAGQIKLSGAAFPGLTTHGGSVLLNQSGQVSICNGNFTLNTNTTYQTTLNPGNHLTVVGSVTLSNAILSFDSYSNVTTDQIITNIVNDGTDPVIGTFKDLPQGSLFNVNGKLLRISYTGGTGNDVILIVQKFYLTNTMIMPDKSLQFNGAAPIGTSVVLQTSTNLVDWVNFITNDAPAGSFSCTDTNAASLPFRFYRARLLQ